MDDWGKLVQGSDVLFLCLPTPRRRDGRIDLRPLIAGMREMLPALRAVRTYRLVVIKSTVVPGTTEKILRPLLEASRHGSPTKVHLAVNPEFLAEGTMIRDVLHPERIVIGVTSRTDARALRILYGPFRAPVVELTPTGAELTKYAANASLAMRVAFTNELSRIAEASGEDVDRVMAAVGMDPRIGSRFLSAGPGFGGSCFEKDARALAARSRELGVRPRLLEALVPSNEDQTRHAFELVRRAGGPLRGRRVAVLGLSFKEGTDDVRESRALPLVRWALEDGARLRLHDPVARESFRRLLEGAGETRLRRVRFASTASEAVRGADLAVLQAAWPEYLDFPRGWVRSMRRPLVVDLRRALPDAVRFRGDLRCVRLGDGTNLPGRGRRR